MILQQLSYSEINPEQLDLFSCLFSLKNKSFATKIHIPVRIAYLWTGLFWQNHMGFVVLKEMDPHLHPGKPETEVKRVKLGFKNKNKKTKQKSFIQITSTPAGQFGFQYLDTN